MAAVWAVLSLAAAAWIVWQSRDDIRLLSGTSLWVLAGMVGAHAASLLTQSERLRIILEHHSRSAIPLVTWTRLFVRGRLYSFAVPQSGHLYRGLTLRRDHQTSGWRYVSSVATQTWMALVTGLFIATITLALFPGVDTLPNLAVSISTLAMLTLLVGFAPFATTRLWRFLPSRLRSSRMARRAKEAWVLGTRSARSGPLIVVFAALVLMGLIAGGFGLRVAFMITGQEIAWTAAIAVLAVVHLGNLVSVIPGNLGIQELGLAALGVLFGYSAALGVIASLIVRLSNIAALVVLSLLLEGAVVARRRSLAA